MSPELAMVLGALGGWLVVMLAILLGIYMGSRR